MHYQQHLEVTLDQRCEQCKLAFKEDSPRYFCCNRKRPVCQKCQNKVCSKCKKARVYEIGLTRCATKKCLKKYDKEDMFYDFKANYFFCPRCMMKDYNYYYNKSLKLNKPLQEIKLLKTDQIYPYKDLVTYFKQWCFCCANRIGEKDAFEMRMGPRICNSCVSLNVDNMINMIMCICCKGYIHTEEEISEVMGSDTEVLCTYCANNQKEVLSQVEQEGKKQEIRISELQSPKLRGNRILSAFEKSKIGSDKNKQSSEVKEIKKSKIKTSTLHSMEYEAMDVPLNIRFSNYQLMCEVCGSIVDKENSFAMKKVDPSVSSSFLKLFRSKSEDIRICFICYGQNFTDRGQTIQFETPLSRTSQNLQNQQNRPVKDMKPAVPGMGASQGLFSPFAKEK